jgi:hypothetical protein
VAEKTGKLTNSNGLMKVQSDIAETVASMTEDDPEGAEVKELP